MTGQPIYGLSKEMKTREIGEFIKKKNHANNEFYDS